MLEGLAGRRSVLKFAAQYLRMSTTQQKYSLENQRGLIAAYAARHGYKISATYEDAGRSGLSINQRSGLQALLRDVASSPEFSVILVVDVSRWGRYQDPDEAAHYEFLCRDAGVVVKYCAETFDDDGSTGSALMKSFKRAMASEYSRQLSDRVKAGRQRGLALGSCQGAGRLMASRGKRIEWMAYLVGCSARESAPLTAMSMSGLCGDRQ